MSEYESPGLFDLLDEAGVDMDDPQWSGMDAFDVAEHLGISAEDGEQG